MRYLMKWQGHLYYLLYDGMSVKTTDGVILPL